MTKRPLARPRWLANAAVACRWRRRNALPRRPRSHFAEPIELRLAQAAVRRVARGFRRHPIRVGRRRTPPRRARSPSPALAALAAAAGLVAALASTEPIRSAARTVSASPTRFRRLRAKQHRYRLSLAVSPGTVRAPPAGLTMEAVLRGSWGAADSDSSQRAIRRRDRVRTKHAEPWAGAAWPLHGFQAACQMRVWPPASTGASGFPKAWFRAPCFRASRCRWALVQPAAAVRRPAAAVRRRRPAEPVVAACWKSLSAACWELAVVAPRAAAVDVLAVRSEWGPAVGLPAVGWAAESVGWPTRPRAAAAARSQSGRPSRAGASHRSAPMTRPAVETDRSSPLDIADNAAER